MEDYLIIVCSCTVYNVKPKPLESDVILLLQHFNDIINYIFETKWYNYNLEAVNGARENKI